MRISMQSARGIFLSRVPDDSVTSGQKKIIIFGFDCVFQNNMSLDFAHRQKVLEDRSNTSDNSIPETPPAPFSRAWYRYQSHRNDLLKLPNREFQQIVRCGKRVQRPRAQSMIRSDGASISYFFRHYILFYLVCTAKEAASHYLLVFVFIYLRSMLSAVHTVAAEQDRERDGTGF